MFADEYNYDLPKTLIANEPVEPRDSARLFVYNTGTNEIFFDTFANLSRYVPSGAVMVLNDTKVVPARLTLTKSTGGMVNILFLVNEWNGGEVVKGLPDRAIAPGEKLSLVNHPLVEMASHEREEFSFRLLASADSFREALRIYGRTPLPPYIHSNMSEEKVREEYQTIFAVHSASVAAPTASLHFTSRVFDSLDKKGVIVAKATLDVGRGTFSPVTPEMEKSGVLHAEPMSISTESASIISSAKTEHRPVVAVGTTSLRILETAAEQILARRGFQGDTKLFIRPPYSFKIADALITNFHLPGTSLLALVDAFLQSKQAHRSWRELYDIAAKDRFRFYSFGDAMLVL